MRLQRQCHCHNQQYQTDDEQNQQHLFQCRKNNTVQRKFQMREEIRGVLEHANLLAEIAFLFVATGISVNEAGISSRVTDFFVW